MVRPGLMICARDDASAVSATAITVSVCAAMSNMAQRARQKIKCRLRRATILYNIQ